MEGAAMGLSSFGSIPERALASESESRRRSWALRWGCRLLIRQTRCSEGDAAVRLEVLGEGDTLPPVRALPEHRGLFAVVFGELYPCQRRRASPLHPFPAPGLRFGRGRAATPDPEAPGAARRGDGRTEGMGGSRRPSDGDRTNVTHGRILAGEAERERVVSAEG